MYFLHRDPVLYAIKKENQMATLLTNTFPGDQEGRALLRKVKRAIANICAHGISAKGVILTAPTKLK